MLSDKEKKESTCSWCGYLDCTGDCKSITPNEYNKLIGQILILKNKIKKFEKLNIKKGWANKFSEIYEEELKIEINQYTSLELLILKSHTVRSFVYELCKNLIKVLRK
jgi:hypothetical protein